MSIKEWPLTERPREKIINKGVHVLSDAELFAVLFRTGTKGQSAIDLARTALQHFGSLRNLLNANANQFKKISGLGATKYVQLQTVLEISKRYLAENIQYNDILNSSKDTELYLRSRLRDKTQEIFACLFLNTQNRLIAYEELAAGTVNIANVYPREVIKRILHHNAVSVIFAHNHPSGAAEPSDSDKALTSLLVQALSYIHVTVLDHFIVADSQVFSFAERGWNFQN